MADAVRQHFIAALARRAEMHQGALRQRLDARLAVLREATMADPAPPVPARPATPGRTAWAGLQAHLQQQKAALPALAPESALPYFRRTWSRLNADQRLAQSRSALPQNAGPLNSQHLVHRSLALMRELSPDYFEHFIAYAEALLWVEQTAARAAPRKAPPGRRA